MGKINLFSIISKSFLKRSRKLVKVLLCTRNINEHDFVYARHCLDENEQSKRHCRNESKHSEEHQYLINGNQQQELEEDDYDYYEEYVKEVITEEVITEDVIDMGLENRDINRCSIKSVEEMEEEEREMRMKVCSEVLWRLEEIEVMESSDLNQVADLNEVVSYYSLIQNDFFVDLINDFIVDVSDVVRKPM